MNKKLIVRVAEGLGNQMFSYAAALSFAKLNSYELYVDGKSAYYKKKNIRDFNLNQFNLSGIIIKDKPVYDNFYKNSLLKISRKIDKLRKKKNFISELKQKNKLTKYNKIFSKNLNNTVYMEGHYECEKYFLDIKDILIKEYILKNYKPNNFLENCIYKNRNRSVGIVLRQNRFSERTGNKDSKISKLKSYYFMKDQLQYIERAVNFFKKKINNPVFYVFSDFTNNLRDYFDEKKFIIINFQGSQKNKMLHDYYFLSKMKNHIVSPTTFHWWPAWLNFKNQQSTLTVRPKNINNSNNIDYWPSKWIKI